MASYFPDNAAKTRSYGIKNSENFEIKHAFLSKSFFPQSNFIHTSCLNAFKPMVENLQNELYQLENKQAKGAKLCAIIR